MEEANSLSVAEQWRQALEAQAAPYDVSALGRDVRRVISEELRSYYLRKVLEYAQLGEGALILEPADVAAGAGVYLWAPWGTELCSLTIRLRCSITHGNSPGMQK